MGRKLDPKDQALYDAVDEVLHYVWDPIGVSVFPTARDEYHSYLPKVFGLLRTDADEGEIATYLGQIVTDRMGLSANEAHDRKVATILIEWKKTIDKKFER